MTKARDLSKLLSTANGKIAGANLDVSFENIADTGTEGTKVASGTTAQRGSTTGQLRFNTQTGLAEYYDGSGFKTINSPPTITAVSPLEVASDEGGNITFTVTGTNFQSGAVVKFIGNDGTEITASTTTVNSGSSISAVIVKSSFVGAKEPYDVKVINTSGLAGTLDNQINVDVAPTWSTASGTLATIQDNATGTHSTVSATDADGDTVSYSETGGTVLINAGLTLNSATGAISGDPTDVNSSTTYSFNLRATANSKTVDRAFNIIVNPTLDGSISTKASTSAQAIKTLNPSVTNGNYWITVDGTPKQVYCDFDGTYTNDASNSYMLYQAYGTASPFSHALNGVYSTEGQIFASNWSTNGSTRGMDTDSWYFFNGGEASSVTTHNAWQISTPNVSTLVIKGGGSNPPHGNGTISVAGSGGSISGSSVQIGLFTNANTAANPIITINESGSSIGRIYYIFAR